MDKEMEEKIRELLARLTLEEKVRLCAGDGRDSAFLRIFEEVFKMCGTDGLSAAQINH